MYIYNKRSIMKGFIASLVMVVIILSLALTNVASIAEAASVPEISKKSRTILIGNRYNLNINNKIKGSTYKWKSSNEDIATVDNRGFVTGVSKGKTVITCTIKAPKETYKVSSTVTIRKPAEEFEINNKVSLLNVGQHYDLNRDLYPKDSNDLTSWSTSDESIAKPDAKGKFTALKEGTVTITGTTLSKKSDHVTIKVVDEAGTVTTQEELNEYLDSGVGLITIKTDNEVELSIPEGDYSKQTLVVDAPKAEVTNKGVFKSIEIINIKPNTWYEQATANAINVSGPNARVVVDANSEVSIISSGTGLTIINNGVISGLTLDSDATVNIEGSGTAPIPVTANIANASITTSVPVNLTCNQKITLTILPGAEASTVTVESEEFIPIILGTGSITVVIGSGENAVTRTIIATPIESSGGGYSGNIPVDNVNVSAISVTGADGATTITTGNGTLQMTAAVTPANASNKAVTWSVVNGTGSATISADGVLQALTNGTVTVRATSVSTPSVSGTAVITISEQIPPAYASTDFKAGDFDVLVDFGTEETVAIADLAQKVEVVGTLGEIGKATIAWTIADFVANTAGNYTATGVLTLPAGWTGSPANLTATVTVDEAIPATKYLLTLTGDNISSEPGAGMIDENTEVTVTVAPATGQHVAIFTVGGEDKKAELATGTPNQYTFTITTDTTVAVTYEADPMPGAQTELAKITDEALKYLPLGTANTEAGVKAALLVLANDLVDSHYNVTVTATTTSYNDVTFTWVGSFTVTDTINPVNTATDVSGRTIVVTIAVGNEIRSVEKLADINVANGTQLVSVDWPEKVEVTLADGSKIYLTITWKIGTPEYNDGKTAGTYVFEGTLDLVDGIANTGDIKATVNVIVAP